MVNLKVRLQDSNHSILSPRDLALFPSPSHQNQSWPRPMAPARSTRRAHSQNAPPPPSDPQHAALFLEPMMGTPLSIYIEKDVDDRDDLVDLITVRASILAYDHPLPSLPHRNMAAPSLLVTVALHTF